MEQWDVYDIHRIKTGELVRRGEEMVGGLHIVVHVCIFNSKGEMLIQQRTDDKIGWPGMWDVTVGGSAVAGDTSQQAASRELFEELGITYDFTGMRPYLTTNFARGFDDVYMLELDVDLDQIVLQKEEVQAVKWASCEEILAMMRRGEFIPYYESFIQLIFDMRFKYGSIRI